MRERQNRSSAMFSIRGLAACLMMLLFSANQSADGFVPRTLIPKQSIQSTLIERIRVLDDSLSFSAFRRKSRVPRFMTSSSSSTASKVVYQKICKPPSNVPPAPFLANLVEYIQDKFELPSNLPMVYEKQQGTTDEFVVTFDSPLSSASSETQLNVQVVAIYTDQEDNSSLPSMAMVVVKKDQATGKGSTVIPMMQNLFAESEKQILRALDRGLDNVQQGTIEFTETNSKEIPANVKSVREAIDAEIIAESKMKAPPSNGSTTNDNTAVTSPSNEDYAVAAAKKVAAKRNSMKQTDITGGDYAVEAAKRAAQKAAVINRKTKQPVAKAKTVEPVRKQPKRFTISTPKQRVERAAKKAATQKVPTKTADSSESVASVDRKKSSTQNNNTAPSSTPTVVKKKDSVESPVNNVNGTRSLNLSVEDTNDDSATADQPLKFETMLEESDRGNRTVSKAQMERDILEAAQKAMSEMKDVEMTPEELLQDVMTFGEEKDKENAAGTGFVSGAFEKAKELLQEQKKQRDERIKEVNVRTVDATSDGSTHSAEEELKRIFKAGERLADGRIEMSKNEQTDSAMTETEVKEQEELDSLIAGEKTVSGYARSLDDELAELEIRINKSPGEELDDPMKNPQFDIFSGPEVYNPNVDPETAVNWPGAQPGTKDVRLPKELDEAVKQAKFAADVMLKMKEVQEDGDTKYIIGSRELQPQQVENIRTVVTEAVEIGLIDDPLNLLAERSRMQMVVDEMRSQPEERYRDIASNFRDLLLSDNFVPIIQERLEAMVDRDLDARRRDDDSVEADHAKERKILGHLVEYAQLLLKEARALGAELEASQLEIVRSICQVAMDPTHKTEEETASALTDAVRDMRPLLDDVFVAYLKYAIAEEEGRLARAGLLDDPEHNEWLFVLKIVQQGVYTEISRGINRYIEHIMYILRMETKAERRMLLSKIIDSMPTMDIRPFVQVVDKIVASLGETARGDFDGYVLGEMSNKILQLRRDVKELLPPERIQLMSRDADEWAEKQKQRLLEQRKVTKQRLQAAQDTTDYDDEIRRRGEMERM